jgi:hypothetical protein
MMFEFVWWDMASKGHFDEQNGVSKRHIVDMLGLEFKLAL